METKINSVKGLCIGQVFNIAGVNYIVTKLPTRYSVCGRKQTPKSGEPNDIKISIKGTPTMFWQHYRTGKFISSMEL